MRVFRTTGVDEIKSFFFNYKCIEVQESNGSGVESRQSKIGLQKSCF